jgi:hypothetical protein
LETWFLDLAPGTDLLRLFDLSYRWPCISDRKEEFWVFIPACRPVPPIHGVVILASHEKTTALWLW